jgi:SAM-dependent methyltransferase
MAFERAERGEVPCNLCGASAPELLYETAPGDAAPASQVYAPDSDHLGGERLVRCRDCGLMYLSPRPAEDHILLGYRDSLADTYVEQRDSRLDSSRRGWAVLSRHLPERGRLLDVGAAAGFFLHAARESGWEVQGVEPSARLRDYARQELGLELAGPTLRHASFPDASFDAATLWDTLEHVADPRAELSELHRVLKPGGLLAISYPDISDPFARLFGRRWWFFLSHHLYYFTPGTLARLLRQAGFEPVSWGPHFQRRTLGYLSRRVAARTGWPGRAAARAVDALGLGPLVVPYYASQRRLYARRRP